MSRDGQTCEQCPRGMVTMDTGAWDVSQCNITVFETSKKRNSECIYMYMYIRSLHVHLVRNDNWYTNRLEHVGLILELAH